LQENTLREAVPYYFSSDECSDLEDPMTTVTDVTLEESDIPHRCGLVVFGRPMPSTSMDDDGSPAEVIPLGAMTWAAVQHREHGPCVSVMCYAPDQAPPYLDPVCDFLWAIGKSSSWNHTFYNDEQCRRLYAVWTLM
jgi:hypothetical protein